MIVFDLQCVNGHCFEGWFEDGKAYEAQKRGGLIRCPVCNDGEVSKIPSTFSIRSSQSVSAMPASGDGGENTELGRKIAGFVKENFDDVGCDFATEALKIHYGVTEPRNIRGVSTKDEEETLQKEGVRFFKVPIPNDPEPDA